MVITFTQCTYFNTRLCLRYWTGQHRLICPKKKKKKKPAALLLHILSLALFTWSFVLGHPPSAYKSTNITALRKQGAKTNPLNYRPISLLPIISEVMESIIAVDMKSFLFSNNLISDHQFGFRLGHSTLDMLSLLMQQWMEAVHVRHEIRATSGYNSCF